MSKVYIVSAKRSAIGSMLGSLKDVTPAYVGGEVLKAALAAGNVEASWLNEVIVGNVLPAGLGQGPGRQVALAAGVPVEIPAYSLNMVCGSGMKAVINAAAAIAAGKADLIAAGGAEIMSGAPYLVSGKTRSGCKMGEMKMIDHMIFDALTDAYGGMHMGITAENVAERFGLTRQMQDEFAIASQQKAAAAQDAGKFVDEIVPVTVKQGKKEFESTKKMQIAAAIINGLAGVAMAVSTAMSLGPIAGPIMAAVNSALVITTTALQIAKIKSTTFDGGGSVSGEVSSASTTPTVAAMEYTPQYSTNVTGESETVNLANAVNEGQRDQRVYVVESDINEAGKRVEVRESESTF